MNRSELQKLTRMRLREAAALLRSGHYEGAYYLSGCAVEHALKACLAKQTQRYDFPDEIPMLDAWGHSLEGLVKIAGFWPDLKRHARFNEIFAVNWAVTKDWTPEHKFELSIDRTVARDLYSAITARKHGVLPWIRNRW